LHLYFKTLQPLEFTDLENVEDDETREEETGVKLSEDNEIANKLIDLGEDEEDILKEYDLIDEHDVDYELDDELNEKIDSTGRANKTKDSEQDGTTKSSRALGYTFLVRYTYTKAPGRAKSSREFCEKMMKAKKVYRKEDIMAMSNVAVNPGARCFHRWTRKIFLRKDDTKGVGKSISTNRAIKAGFKPETNNKKVSIAPKNTNYKGYTAAYWKKMGFKN
jgi:hypothetical protein